MGITADFCMGAERRNRETRVQARPRETDLKLEEIEAAVGTAKIAIKVKAEGETAQHLEETEVEAWTETAMMPEAKIEARASPETEVEVAIATVEERQDPIQKTARRLRHRPGSQQERSGVASRRGSEMRRRRERTRSREEE